MSVAVRFRDMIKSYLPVWLSDKPGQFTGETVGYRFAYVLTSSLDILAERYYQSINNALGIGDPNALPLIGRSRSILRGKTDTNATYLVKLQQWRTEWAEAATRHGIATALHNVLSGNPQVDVYNRGGSCTRCNFDGSITRYTGVNWNFDSVSNPERIGVCPSDLWIVITGSDYALRRGNTSQITTDAEDYLSTGLYLLIPVGDVDMLKGLLAIKKSAASRVRVVIWQSNTLQYPISPTNPVNDGTWGTWGLLANDGSNSYIPGNRRKDVAYWEPN